ncbi:hypothetical protein NFJ02_12g12010 [Pycnococcus provasolii]
MSDLFMANDDARAATLAAAALGLGGLGGSGGGGGADAAHATPRNVVNSGAASPVRGSAAPTNVNGHMQYMHTAAHGSHGPPPPSAFSRSGRVEHEVRGLLRKLDVAERAREAAEMELARMRDAGGETIAAELRAENVSLAMRLKSALALNLDMDRKLRETREESMRIAEQSSSELVVLRQRAIDAKEEGQKRADDDIKHRQRVMELENELHSAKEQLGDITSLRLSEASLKAEVAELRRAVEGYINTGGGTAAAAAANAELVQARAHENALRREVEMLKASMESAMRRVEEAEVQGASALKAQRQAMSAHAEEGLRGEVHALRAAERDLRRELEAVRHGSLASMSHSDELAALRASQAEMRRELEEARHAARMSEARSPPHPPQPQPVYVPVPHPSEAAPIRPAHQPSDWSSLKYMTDQIIQRAEVCHRMAASSGDPLAAQTGSLFATTPIPARAAAMMAAAAAGYASAASRSTRATP